jgi:competence protein ComEA
MKIRCIAALLATLTLGPISLFAAPVNVNQASPQEIAAALSGIGPTKAKAIVDYRKANGPFKSVQDLAKVKGIGQKTLAKLSQDIKLQ